MGEPSKKKTPSDATEFEREQLRFFLQRSNIAAVLADLNPSLAWLPMLAELRLIDATTQLAPWVEKNFAEVEAIREVAANIHFFGSETADILEFRLNQAQGLPPLLMTCWRMIIRHMRAAKRGALRNGWFDIAPRIKRGERSPELLERLAEVLRPRLYVGKVGAWLDDEDTAPEQPTDIISIDYEVDDGLTEEEILSAWPPGAPADADEKLLSLLTNSLTAALEDAIEAGVEGEIGSGLSDRHVPSVAKHEQNAYRTGFLPIVRVMAEIWTRLAQKEAERAIAVIDQWRASDLRLVRRLATFAAADKTVPERVVAEILSTPPAGELLLTSSSVEVYRLIDARWKDLAPDKREAVEKCITDGPPTDWFREEQGEAVERCRFELLGHLERSGIQLGRDAKAVLDDIRKRHPSWQLPPKDQAGFHYWHGGVHEIAGDPAKLSGLSDAELVPAAKKAAETADFMDGDAWQALCQTDASRALRGLSAQAAIGEWPAWAWRPLLWAASKLQDAAELKLLAQLLLACPKESFQIIAPSASWWLNEVAKALDEDLLWPLWDRIAEATSQEVAERNDD